MKKEIISNAITHISSEYIEKAADYTAAKKSRRSIWLKWGAVAACLCVVISSATVAYAADLGGIQRTVQIWFNGEMTAATIQIDGSGTYEVEYTDSTGEVHYEIGGGIAFTPDGREIPVTDKDLVAEITAPDVEYNDDGTVWVYWFNQAVEITDKFEDGVCYVELTDGEESLYMTIKYENGYATSHHKYVSPREFNISTSQPAD